MSEEWLIRNKALPSVCLFGVRSKFWRLNQILNMKMKTWWKWIWLHRRRANGSIPDTTAAAATNVEIHATSRTRHHPVVEHERLAAVRQQSGHYKLGRAFAFTGHWPAGMTAALLTSGSRSEEILFWCVCLNGYKASTKRTWRIMCFAR